MSMTRDEAIEALQKFVNGYEKNICGEAVRQNGFVQAIKVVISALRPITREQVEKVWRGCEKCNGAGEYSRYAENLTKTLLAKYCPHCGRPLTDEAVDMVMERLEALRDE